MPGQVDGQRDCGRESGMAQPRLCEHSGLGLLLMQTGGWPLNFSLLNQMYGKTSWFFSHNNSEGIYRSFLVVYIVFPFLHPRDHFLHLSGLIDEYNLCVLKHVSLSGWPHRMLDMDASCFRHSVMATSHHAL